MSRRPSLRAPSAHLAAWSWLALIHAALLALRLPGELPRATWLQAQGFVVAHTLAIGVALSLAFGVWAWLPQRRTGFGRLVAVLVGWPVLAFLMAEDFSGPITRLPPSIPPTVWLALLGLGATMGLLASFEVGRGFARPGFWWGGLVAVTGVTVVNAHVLPLAYPGLHLWVALASGLFLAATFTEASGSAVSGSRRLLVVGWLCFVGVAAAGFIARPSNRTLLELSYQPVALLMPFIAPHFTERSSPFHIPSNQREWFVDRSRARAVRPTAGNPLPKDALVVMLGIDSLRADVLSDENNRARLPTLFRLRDSGVWFKNARSPGTSTAPALASLFSSRYYSQLYWTTYTKRKPEVFPHSDSSPRFPELLSERGVRTVTVDTAGWLLNEFGIVRGFQDEVSARVRGYPSAADAGSKLRAKLAAQTSGPSLAFIHFLDAHAPYAAGGRAGTPFERYLRSLASVDLELGRWVEFIRQKGLGERVVWVILSDHGEAFGEHGLTFHANSLYEELLRVPLIISAPGLTPGVSDVPVSLIDVGPTMLDLFGVPTPGVMMGQSLLPLLLGQRATLTRPILAEAQLKRALISANGAKVIHDTRRKTWEVYDLTLDPKEMDNLAERDGDHHSDVRGALSAFFAVHTHRREGYEVPFRKW